jgi:hypothetical protein
MVRAWRATQALARVRPGRPAVRAGHIERVEIVHDETLGVEGRAGYYERRMRR